MVPLHPAMSELLAHRRIQAENISIAFGSTPVLERFTWTHAAGKIAWLVGENGAGKSSLMRVLAGRSRPSRGRVLHVGSTSRRSPQPGTLYYHPGMHLPGEASVGDWRRLVRSLSRRLEARPEIESLIPGGVPARRRIRKLSTGEAKRLLLGALLARPAEFLLLDEPFEHLSAGARDGLTNLLRARAKREVVVVASNQAIPRAGDGPVVRLSRTDGPNGDPG